MAKKKKNITLTSNYVLPSDNTELQTFSRKFKVDMMEQVVNSIEYAVTNHLPFVEVFQFKNYDFVITLAQKDYLANLDNIFEYYMKNEVYEHCSRVAKLQKSLKQSVNTIDEKQKR